MVPPQCPQSQIEIDRSGEHAVVPSVRALDDGYDVLSDGDGDDNTQMGA